MKEKVLQIKMTAPNILGQGSICLFGKNHLLTMHHIPFQTLQAIHFKNSNAIEEADRADRLPLTAVLRKLLDTDTVHDVFIDSMKDTSYKATLTLKNHTEICTLPSTGILLACAFGIPIYFENTLNGVEEIDEGSTPIV